jgi:hypothetical protein
VVGDSHKPQEPPPASSRHQFEMIRIAAGDGIHAVALQAHRIRHAEAILTAFGDKWSQREADARFLIVALRWVHRQCAAAARMTGDAQLGEAVAEFEQAVFDGAAKQMRDVLSADRRWLIARSTTA